MNPLFNGIWVILLENVRNPTVRPLKARAGAMEDEWIFRAGEVVGLTEMWDDDELCNMEDPSGRRIYRMAPKPKYFKINLKKLKQHARMIKILYSEVE